MVIYMCVLCLLTTVFPFNFFVYMMYVYICANVNVGMHGEHTCGGQRAAFNVCACSFIAAYAPGRLAFGNSPVFVSHVAIGEQGS